MYDEEKHINLSDRNKNPIDDNYMIYRSYGDYMKEYIEVSIMNIWYLYVNNKQGYINISSDGGIGRHEGLKIP